MEPTTRRTFRGWPVRGGLVQFGVRRRAGGAPGVGGPAFFRGPVHVGVRPERDDRSRRMGAASGRRWSSSAGSGCSRPERRAAVSGRQRSADLVALFDVAGPLRSCPLPLVTSLPGIAGRGRCSTRFPEGERGAVLRRRCTRVAHGTTAALVRPDVETDLAWDGSLPARPGFALVGRRTARRTWFVGCVRGARRLAVRARSCPRAVGPGGAARSPSTRDVPFGQRGVPGRANPTEAAGGHRPGPASTVGRTALCGPSCWASPTGRSRVAVEHAQTREQFGRPIGLVPGREAQAGPTSTSPAQTGPHASCSTPRWSSDDPDSGGRRARALAGGRDGQGAPAKRGRGGSRPATPRTDAWGAPRHHRRARTAHLYLRRARSGALPARRRNVRELPPGRPPLRRGAGPSS